MSMNGKVAVVTGAARGLGRAICLRLAEDGVNISVWDLNLEGAEETADAVRKLGVQAIACGGDSSCAEDIAVNLEYTKQKLGKVSILVNNAALSPFARFEEINEQMWDRLLAIDLKGPFLCCQAMIPEMKAAGWGRIINISSSAAQTGASCSVHYAAAKAGVLGLTRSLAIEYATSGITVNAVPPGFVDTEGLQEAPIDIEKQAKNYPMKRSGKPRNIAAAVAFLASEDADYITGHTLSVNGGRYCN